METGALGRTGVDVSAIRSADGSGYDIDCSPAAGQRYADVGMRVVNR